MKVERAKEGIFSSAAILVIGSVIAKVLGALYRVPLTNILGAEGMGMYQLIFPVFALTMVLGTLGVPTALSRIVAEKRAFNEPARKYLFSALLILGAISTLLAILIFSLSGYIGKWQGNAATADGYKIIAPTLIFVCLIAGFRGYFQGEMFMIPTAISNIIEQSVKLGAGIALSVVLRKRGVIAAVCGALLGVLISEVAAFIYLAITYVVRSKKRPADSLKIRTSDARDMLKVAFPIAIVAVLLPLSNFFDSIIMVNMLKLRGDPVDLATAEYGLLSGPVNSLINMPVVLIMSLAVVIVPSVSMSRVRRDIDGVMLKSRLSIRLCYLIGIPCAAFFIVFAPRLLPIIYPLLTPTELALSAKLLRTVACNVVFLSAMQIYVSLLQALDKTKYAVLSLVFAIIAKMILSVLLTRYIGILGGALASVVMAFSALALMVASYIKICGLHLEKNIALNLLSGVIIALIGALISNFIASNSVATIIGSIVCAAAYVYMAFLFGLVTKDDIDFLPLKRVWMRVYRIVRFWEYRDET